MTKQKEENVQTMPTEQAIERLERQNAELAEILEVVPESRYNGIQSLIETNATAIESMKRDEPMKERVFGRDYDLRYYCPNCGKQQKNSLSHKHKDWFCEWCGQKLTRGIR